MAASSGLTWCNVPYISVFSCTLNMNKVAVSCKSNVGRMSLILCRHLNSSKTKKQTPSDYCMATVRKYDYEAFLCTLLLPKDVRSAAFAVRALNAELAQVRDLVSTPHIGLIRMQFWKDALDEIFKGNSPEQPIALELTRIIKRRQLSKQWFRRLIESREELMTDKAFKSVQELEHYAEWSMSSIYYIILEASDVKDVQCDHVGSHLGKAQGIVNLLRGVPFNASKSRVYLPLDIMVQNGLSQEDVIRKKEKKALSDVVFHLASIAHQHLQKAQSLKVELPKNVTPLFLPAVACSSYLKKLQHAGFNVFDSKLQLRNNWLPLSLWWHRVRSTY